MWVVVVVGVCLAWGHLDWCPEGGEGSVLESEGVSCGGRGPG